MTILASLKVRIATAVVTLIPIYYFSLGYNLSHPTVFFSSFRDVARQEFITHALEHQVSDPFDISILSNLCQNRQSRNDVIVTCQPGTGGIGNIRSYILHCTRFAIEAGASMILPRFHRRSRSDLFELVGELGDFEHFFDRAHFIDTLQEACPRMRVYQNMRTDWTVGNVEIPHWPHAINVSSRDQPSPWRREFNKWFNQSTVSLSKPVVVASGDPGRDRAVIEDGLELYYTIGRILQFRPDARRLAALCMSEISRRFNLQIDPKQNLYANAYMGAHLRTSSDAVKAGWNPDFEGQTDWYIAQTRAHNLTVIYAAGGNDADLTRFAAKAAEQTPPIAVVNKHDLLAGNDLRELENLLWDQRGLVDFEVLLKASQYGGYARSSFSHNVAFRRHFVSKVEDPFADPEHHFRDEISVVYGRYDPGWEDEGVRTMWP